MWSVKNLVSNQFNWKKILISVQDICIQMKSHWRNVVRSRFVNFYVNWRLIPKTASLSSFFLMIYLIYMEHNYAIIYDIRSQPFVYTIKNNYLLTEFFSTHLQVDAFGEIKIRVRVKFPQKIQWNGKALAEQKIDECQDRPSLADIFSRFPQHFLRFFFGSKRAFFSCVLQHATSHDGSVAEHSWFGLFK